MFYFILIALFSACNLPTPECNSQDKNSSCYMIPPIIGNISSYDSRSIEIEFDNIDFETGNIIIIRESSADTITIYNPESPITNAYPYYRDAKDIVMGQRYDYIIKFIDNEQNESVAADTFITHELAIPHNFSIEQISAATIGLSWAHTPIIKDINQILGFEIIREIKIGQIFSENTTINIPDRSATTYSDTSLIPFTTYAYKMRTRYTNDDFSDYTSLQTKDLEFPQIETVSWYSKNLETISISIIFDDLVYEDVQMSLSRRRDESANQSDEYEPVFSGYLLNNLDKYLDILESPFFNERWEYMLDWWSGSYHDTVYVPIITLPSNLVYIEGTEGEEFILLDTTIVIEPFYVFTTETPNRTSDFFGGYDAPPNFLQEYEIFPKASKVLGEIIQEINGSTQDWYINPASNSYSSIFSYATSGNIPDSPNLDNPGLRLLMEYEWEYLARNGGDDNYEDYSFGGVFNAASLNSYNAGDDTHAPFGVGSFEPSPFGIFDLNGNVWEWCHSIEEKGKYVLRGGSYQDQGYECSNASRREISDLSLNEIQDSSIGYRMAISAIPFIVYLNNIRCNEKKEEYEGYNGCFE